MSTQQIRMAARRFARFHGFKAKRVPDSFWKAPKAFAWIGQAHAIEYICDKHNGGGDGTVATYRHVFDTPVQLFMDSTGRKQLYLIGPKLKVTSAGIEN